MPKKLGTTPDWHNFDKAHLWHPYTSMHNALPTYPVVSADGVRLTLADGTKLIDGMASWWSAIHGYNHPVLNEAARTQLGKMSHVMFGGLAHEPASQLGSQLLALLPESLKYVFFADSGSISVEVAMKMALQYWFSAGKPGRCLFLTPRGGYHGDPFAAMSVTDPINGMHHIFEPILPKQIFVSHPSVGFDDPWDPASMDEFRAAVASRGEEIAAVILEPIVQGAGGMRFYHPEYLKEVRRLCDENELLLIADEIATGFGRTGTMFACEHAEIVPDIICLGKALTGGMVTLAATITNDRVVSMIQQGPHPELMHGPTFMANPLACAIASASIDLLTQSNWPASVARISQQLRAGLDELNEHRHVADVRVLGAIGVVEMRDPVDMAKVQRRFVELGVWVRPFGRLIYVMPPYSMNDADIAEITEAIRTVVHEW